MNEQDTAATIFAIGDRVRIKGSPCFGKVTAILGMSVEICWLCHPDNAPRCSGWLANDVEHID
jgi:hypothetical protein